MVVGSFRRSGESNFQATEIPPARHRKRRKLVNILTVILSACEYSQPIIQLIVGAKLKYEALDSSVVNRGSIQSALDIAFDAYTPGHLAPASQRHNLIDGIGR